MDQTTHYRIYVERTLALIKPDAIHKAEEIEDVILKSGFIILQVGLNPGLYSNGLSDKNVCSLNHRMC